MKHDHGPCCLYSITLLTCLTLLPTTGAALPNVSVNDVNVTEGTNTSAVFTVSIDSNPASGQDLRVRVATQNGTAIAGQDYSTRSTTLTFRRNRSLTQTFSVPILNDAIVESTETFRVILSTPVNGVIADSEGIGRIVDNDTPPNRSPICTIDSPAAAVTIRTGTSVTYSSTVTDPDGDPVTINWSFSGGAPATSSIQDPGAVTYGIAGTYTATLSATDNRGAACPPQSRAITVTDPPNVSINSTSQNSAEPVVSVVSTQSRVTNANYSLFAINDLGMHCADLDARVVNILPPYQVLLAQLVQKGTRPVLNPSGISLWI